jgi:uncharacterized delta-60 repeat protein
MKKIVHFIGLCCLAASAANPSGSFAQDGTLDVTFDTDGITAVPIGTSDDYGLSMTLQPDGKMVTAGYIYNGANADFALTRYNTDGSLDLTFSGDGMLTTAIGGSDEEAYSVVIQPDGKILVAGLSSTGFNYEFALVRYNTDGSLDLSFDTDGKVTTGVGLDDYAFAVDLQADGKIVVAGTSFSGTNYDFAVARYNSDGSLDPTFDTDGMLLTDLGSEDILRCMTVQADGKILVAGCSFNGANDDFALARYNTDGSLDLSFDTDGKKIHPLGSGNDEIKALVVQPDGKIVVAGFTNNGPESDFALVRYNADGSLDPGFSSDGTVTTDIGPGPTDDFAYSLALQSDGKIVTAGFTHNGSNYDFALTRHTADGSLDPVFDGDGKLTTVAGTPDSRAFSVAIQTDGKIVAAGESNNGSNIDFAAARYTNCVSVFYTQSPTICEGESITVGLNIYSTDGTYTDTLVSSGGCDSIVTTNLTVNPMPALTTSLSGFTITATQIGATYQWLDCSLNAPIPGATNQAFTVTANGSYGVIVTLNGCSDTSICSTISDIGFESFSTSGDHFSLYPNPFSKTTTLRTNLILTKASLTIFNAIGGQVGHIDEINGSVIIFDGEYLPDGIYFIHLTQEGQLIYADRLVIQD